MPEGKPNGYFGEELVRVATICEELKDTVQMGLGNVQTALRTLPCREEGERIAKIEAEFARCRPIIEELHRNSIVTAATRSPSSQFSPVKSSTGITKDDLDNTAKIMIQKAEEAAESAIECTAEEMIKRAISEASTSARKEAEAAAQIVVNQVLAAKKKADEEATEARRKTITWRLSTIAAIVTLAVTILGGLGTVMHYSSKAEASSQENQKTLQEIKKSFSAPRVVFVQRKVFDAGVSQP